MEVALACVQSSRSSWLNWDREAQGGGLRGAKHVQVQVLPER